MQNTNAKQESEETTPVAGQETSSPDQKEGKTEERYEYWQSKYDGTKNELLEKERKLAEMEEKLKGKMDEEEREKYELVRSLEQEKNLREQAEIKARQVETDISREELLREYPHLKRWKTSFVGTKEQMQEQMKNASKELEEWEKERKSTKTETSQIGSSRAAMTSSGEISEGEFAKLPLNKQREYLKARGVIE